MLDEIMNFSQRIETVLRGEFPDRIPFTIYPGMLPRGAAERKLREKGLGFSWRTEVIDWQFPNCRVESCSYAEKEKMLTYPAPASQIWGPLQVHDQLARTTWCTPVGEVYSTVKLGGPYGSNWTVEHPIKRRDDYRVVEYIARDAVPCPAFDKFSLTKKIVGEDGYVLAHLGYSPLMEIIVNLIGLNNFAYHLADHADLFWSLYEALCAKMRRAYPIVAQSPAHLVLYCGNVHPEVIGLARFEQYLIPCYNECADYLHENGKLLGVHLDADTQLFKNAIANCKLDVVEAFTPPPDCDLSIQDARDAWPEKILWINFPSSLHLAPEKTIRQATQNMLREAAPGNKFIIGITEDIPEDCWATSLNVIADIIAESGSPPITV